MSTNRSEKIEENSGDQAELIDRSENRTKQRNLVFRVSKRLSRSSHEVRRLAGVGRRVGCRLAEQNYGTFKKCEAAG